MSGVLEALSAPLKKYVTRILQSYLGKYIKDIQLDGLGLLDDVVLNNLELRLDVLQELIPTPLAFTFTRGFVKELRIIIPWTQLFSQPIQVKLNNLECILTAKSKQVFHSDIQSPLSSAAPVVPPASVTAPPAKRSDVAADDPMASVPKWLQTRLLTIVANVGVSISNLVFKYQHADVICSVGMDSLKYLSASALEWEPSFQQLEGPRKLIHKVCDIKGLTITLDRKRRTGSAEMPIMSRAWIRARAQLCLDPTAPLDASAKVPAVPTTKPTAARSRDGPSSGSSSTKGAHILSSLPPMCCGGAGASGDVNHAFGSLMRSGAALALVDVHVSNLDFNLSTLQCDMIQALTTLPDDADAVVPAVAPPAAPPPLVPEPIPVDSPAAASAESQKSPSTSQGWASWAWGVVVGSDDKDAPDEDSLKEVPSPESQPIKHDTVTVLNAHIGGITLTLYRRVLAYSSRRRRGSLIVEDARVGAAPSPHSTGGPTGDSTSLPRADSPHSDTSSFIASDTRSSTVRQVIQVPVHNVGFVAVPVTPAHAPVQTLISVPFLVVTLSASSVQARIHDLCAGHALSSGGRKAANIKVPVQVLDVYADIGRVCIEALAPVATAPLSSEEQQTGPPFRLLTMGDFNLAPTAAADGAPKCVAHPHTFSCLFDDTALDEDTPYIVSDWWQHANVSTTTGNGLFDAVPAPVTTGGHGLEPLAAQIRMCIVRPNPTNSAQTRLDAISGVRAVTSEVLGPLADAQTTKKSSLRYPDSGDEAAGTDTETEDAPTTDSGSSTAAFTILRAHIAPLCARFDTWTVQQVQNMIYHALPTRHPEDSLPDGCDGPASRALPSSGTTGATASSLSASPAFDVVVELGGVQLWSPASSSGDGPEDANTIDPRTVDVWLTAEVKAVSCRFQKAVPYAVQTSVILPQLPPLIPLASIGDKVFTAGIDNLARAAPVVSLNTAVGVALDITAVNVGLVSGLPSLVAHGRRLHNMELSGIWAAWAVRCVQASEGMLPHSSHHEQDTRSKALPPLMPSCSAEGHVVVQAGVSRARIDVSPQAVCSMASGLLTVCTPFIAIQTLDEVLPQSCRPDASMCAQLDGVCIGLSAGKTSKAKYGDGGFSFDARIERCQLETNLSSAPAGDARPMVCLCWPSLRAARGSDTPVALTLSGRGTSLPNSVTATACQLLSAGLWFVAPSKSRSRKRFGFNRRRQSLIDTSVSSSSSASNSPLVNPTANLFLESAPCDVDWNACVSLAQAGMGIAEAIVTVLSRAVAVSTATEPTRLAPRQLQFDAAPVVNQPSAGAVFGPNPLQADLSAWLWALQAVSANEDSTPRSAVTVHVAVYPWMVTAVAGRGQMFVLRTPTIELRTVSAPDAATGAFRMQSGVVLDAVVDGLRLEASTETITTARSVQAVSTIVDVGVAGRVVWKCQFTAPPRQAVDSPPAATAPADARNADSPNSTLFWVGFQSTAALFPLSIDVSATHITNLLSLPLPTLAAHSCLRLPPAQGESLLPEMIPLDEIVPSIDDVLGAFTVHITYDVALTVRQADVTCRSAAAPVRHLCHGIINNCELGLIGSSQPLPSLDVSVRIGSINLRSVEQQLDARRDIVLPVLCSVLMEDGLQTDMIDLKLGITPGSLTVAGTLYPLDILADASVIQWMSASIHSMLPPPAAGHGPPASTHQRVVTPQADATATTRIPRLPTIDIRVNGLRVLVPSSQPSYEDEAGTVDGLTCGGFVVLTLDDVTASCAREQQTTACSVRLSGLSIGMGALSNHYRASSRDARPLFRGDYGLVLSHVLHPLSATVDAKLVEIDENTLSIAVSGSISAVDVVLSSSNIAELIGCALPWLQLSVVRAPSSIQTRQVTHQVQHAKVSMCFDVNMRIPRIHVGMCVVPSQPHNNLALQLAGISCTVSMPSFGRGLTHGSFGVDDIDLTGCCDALGSELVPILCRLGPMHTSALRITIDEREPLLLSPVPIRPFDITAELFGFALYLQSSCIENSLDFISSVMEAVRECFPSGVSRAVLSSSPSGALFPPIPRQRSLQELQRSATATVFQASFKIVTSNIQLMLACTSSNHTYFVVAGLDQLFVSLNVRAPGPAVIMEPIDEDDGENIDSDAIAASGNVSLSGLFAGLHCGAARHWARSTGSHGFETISLTDCVWPSESFVLHPLHLHATAELSPRPVLPSTLAVDVHSAHIVLSSAHVSTALTSARMLQRLCASPMKRLRKASAFLKRVSASIPAVQVLPQEAPLVSVEEANTCLTALKLARRTVASASRPHSGECVMSDTAVWQPELGVWQTCFSWRARAWLGIVDVSMDEPVLLPTIAFDDPDNGTHRAAPRVLSCILQHWDDVQSCFVDVLCFDVMVQVWGGAGSFGGPREERVSSPFIRNVRRVSVGVTAYACEWRLLWSYGPFTNCPRPAPAEQFTHNTHIAIATSLFGSLKLATIQCDRFAPILHVSVMLADVSVSVRHDCGMLAAPASSTRWSEEDVSRLLLPQVQTTLHLWQSSPIRLPREMSSAMIPQLRLAVRTSARVSVMDLSQMQQLPVLSAEGIALNLLQSCQSSDAHPRTTVKVAVASVDADISDVSLLTVHHFVNAVNHAGGVEGPATTLAAELSTPTEACGCMRYNIKNACGITLFFGQGGTVEARRLDYGERCSYAWLDMNQSSRCLRFALVDRTGAPGSWGMPIDVGTESAFRMVLQHPLRIHDADTPCILWVSVCLNGLHADVTVHGSHAFKNHFPFAVEARWWITQPAVNSTARSAVLTATEDSASESTGSFLSLNSSTGKLRFQLPFSAPQLTAAPEASMPHDAGQEYLSTSLDFTASVDVDAFHRPAYKEISDHEHGLAAGASTLPPSALPSTDEPLDVENGVTSACFPASPDNAWSGYVQFKRVDELGAVFSWSAVVPLSLDALDSEETGQDAAFLVRLPPSVHSTSASPADLSSLDIWAWCVVRRLPVCRNTVNAASPAWLTASLWPVAAVDNDTNIAIDAAFKRSDGVDSSSFIGSDDVLWKHGRQFKVAAEAKLLQQKLTAEEAASSVSPTSGVVRGKIAQFFDGGGVSRYWDWGPEASSRGGAYTTLPFMDPLLTYNVTVAQSADGPATDSIQMFAAAIVPSHHQLQALSAQAALLAAVDAHATPSTASRKPSPEPAPTPRTQAGQLDAQALADIALASASAQLATLRATVQSPATLPAVTPSALAVDESMSVLPALHVSLDVFAWLRLHGDRDLSQARLPIAASRSSRDVAPQPKLVSRVPTAVLLHGSALQDLGNNRHFLLPFAPQQTENGSMAMLARVSSWNSHSPTLRIKLQAPFVINNKTDTPLLLRARTEPVEFRHAGQQRDASIAKKQVFSTVVLPAGGCANLFLLAKRGVVMLAFAEGSTPDEPGLCWSTPTPLRINAGITQLYVPQLSNTTAVTSPIHTSSPRPGIPARFATLINMSAVSAAAPDAMAGQCIITLSPAVVLHNATKFRLLAQPCYPCHTYSASDDVRMMRPMFEVDCSDSALSTRRLGTAAAEHDTTDARCPLLVPLALRTDGSPNIDSPAPFFPFSLSCLPTDARTSVLDWSGAIVVRASASVPAWSPYGGHVHDSQPSSDTRWDAHALQPSDAIHIVQVPLCGQSGHHASKVLVSLAVTTQDGIIHVTAFQDTQPPVRITNRTSFALGVKLPGDAGTGRVQPSSHNGHMSIGKHTSMDFDWRCLSHEPLSQPQSTPPPSPQHAYLGLINIDRAVPLLRMKQERVFPKDERVRFPFLQICVIPNVPAIHHSFRAPRLSTSSVTETIVDEDTQSIASSSRFAPLTLLARYDELPQAPAQVSPETTTPVWCMPTHMSAGQHRVRVKRTHVSAHPRMSMFDDDHSSYAQLCVSVEVQGSTTWFVIDDITDVPAVAAQPALPLLDIDAHIGELRLSMYHRHASAFSATELLRVLVTDSTIATSLAPRIYGSALVLAATEELSSNMPRQSPIMDTVVGSDGSVNSSVRPAAAVVPGIHRGVSSSVLAQTLYASVQMGKVSLFGPIAAEGRWSQLGPVFTLARPASAAVTPAAHVACTLLTHWSDTDLELDTCAAMPVFLHGVDARLAPMHVCVDDEQALEIVHCASSTVTAMFAQHAHMLRAACVAPLLSTACTAACVDADRHEVLQAPHRMSTSARSVSAWRCLSSCRVTDLPATAMKACAPHFTIGFLHLSELTLVLTVHATRPVFIGVDNMTFTMSPIILAHVCASGPHLLRELLAQLIADAILSSPALLGSLEVLGNPTGLVRSVTEGLYDVFAMPLRSLKHGRGAGNVMRDAAAGWVSLVTHVSEAALHSVSGVAGTLSRNLDRVSLSEAEIRAREAHRRRNAAAGTGITASVASGVRVLTSDVLSAAVGVVSDPIAATTSTGWRFSSFMKGVGKGLLGAVTKPVSGALDLVSQASQGLLNSSGLNTHHPAHVSCRVLRGELLTGLRIRWKCLPAHPLLMYCVHAPATVIVTHPLHDLFGTQFRCTVVVTAGAVVIVSPLPGDPICDESIAPWHAAVPLPHLHDPSLSAVLPGVWMRNIRSVDDAHPTRELLSLRCASGVDDEYSLKIMLATQHKRIIVQAIKHQMSQTQ